MDKGKHVFLVFGDALALAVMKKASVMLEKKMSSHHIKVELFKFLTKHRVLFKLII